MIGRLFDPDYSNFERMDAGFEQVLVVGSLVFGSLDTAAAVVAVGSLADDDFVVDSLAAGIQIVGCLMLAIVAFDRIDLGSLQLGDFDN